ncbi:hypothetical protein PN36_18835 [Candidatus Thiomargarita nelsonii]|uniref:Uncharacterized protein n=1 Tax=Candidatus Thiomargarita nelsonii TaxID=1003181 RepID=A0A0A6P3T1_9GAMM|nr:hypothetical protein PN36_18835 [Candidatus Thiomargarita nelsonii]
MNITFKTNKLQKLFNKKKELIRKYGERRAKLIQLRMVQIQAAQSLAYCLIQIMIRYQPVKKAELIGHK